MTCLICNLLPCNFVRPHPAHITHAALSGRWTIVMSLPKKTYAGNVHIHQDVCDKVVKDFNSMFHLLLGHVWRLIVVVPRPCQRKCCLLTPLRRTSCLISAALGAYWAYQGLNASHFYSYLATFYYFAPCLSIKITFLYVITLNIAVYLRIQGWNVYSLTWQEKGSLSFSIVVCKKVNIILNLHFSCSNQHWSYVGISLSLKSHPLLLIRETIIFAEIFWQIWLEYLKSACKISLFYPSIFGWVYY